MNRAEAKQYILENAKNFLQPADKSGFVCPICSSGTGKKGTGITTKDGIHFTCWRGCFKNADIFEIVGLRNHLSSFQLQFNYLCDYFGLAVSKYVVTKHNIHNKSYTTKVTQPNKTPTIKTQTKSSLVDYTEFFKKANADLDKTTYKRGLSNDVLNKFCVGFIPEWYNPAHPEYKSPRLIIPTSKYSYIARATDDNPLRVFKTPNVSLLNLDVLKTATQPIFIVEGEIDALSIIDAGYEAIGLGGLSGVTRFLQEVELVKPDQPIIWALDNDKQGLDETIKLQAEKRSLPAFFHFADVGALYLGKKDANEAFCSNKQVFKAGLEQEKQKAIKALLSVEAERINEYIQKRAVQARMASFLPDIKRRNEQAISTGFKGVDDILDGGLFPGLYVVGAVSSLGKTTFILQVADQIAKSGRDVLVFSLEMGINELVAKSISRYTFIIDRAQGGGGSNASTTRNVLTGAKYSDFEAKQLSFIDQAITRYTNECSGHIFIVEGVGDVDVERIKEEVGLFVNVTKRKPVVVIDYLQIISPHDIKATDKQNTDYAVLMLKRLSRDFNIPVIGISSFNRENYTAPVNLSSYKESGNIEYSADVLIGLQYEGMDYQSGEKESARTARVRQLVEDNNTAAKAGDSVLIDVKVLKSRNGSRGTSVLSYWPMFNFFEDNVSYYNPVTNSYNYEDKKDDDLDADKIAKMFGADNSEEDWLTGKKITDNGK